VSSSFDPATAYATPPVAALPDRACNGVDLAIFYPQTRYDSDDFTSYDLLDRRDPKDICRSCPHRQPCLDWALATRQVFGVWGGTTPAERARILKEAS
jgi:WhiB family redox-sensing transcriptional regulator